MTDAIPWPDTGHGLLEKGADGYLRLSDAFLARFLERPELAPMMNPALKSVRCTPICTARPASR